MVGRLQTAKFDVVFEVFVCFAAISLIDLHTRLFPYNKVTPTSTDVIALIRSHSEQSLRGGSPIES